MSNPIDIELVRENYQQMSNEELIHIATEDATGMTVEAQQILKEEIVRRKLDETMIKTVDAQASSWRVLYKKHTPWLVRETRTKAQSCR